MRPRYEAQGDRDSERDIADTFAQYCGGEAIKLPGAYADVDFAFIRKGIIAGFFEVKDRTGWRPEYRTVFLSVAKARSMISYHQLGVNVCYVVRLRGIVYFQQITPEALAGVEIRWGGRTDRNDPQDSEPVFLLPVEHMKSIGG
jgi:hypothetical protein